MLDEVKPFFRYSIQKEKTNPVVAYFTKVYALNRFADILEDVRKKGKKCAAQ